MQDKNAKTSTNEQEKGFSILRTDTIQLWVWLEGHQPLEEQSLKSVSEDISYRIREVTDCAVNYMHHCKRSNLKTSDMNKAFQVANIEKTFGYSNEQSLTFNKIQTQNINDKILKTFQSNLFELKDSYIELKLSDLDNIVTNQNKVRRKVDRNLYGKWLLVNGNEFNNKSYVTNNNTNNPSGESLASNENLDIENELLLAPLNQVYIQYYDMFSSIILKLYDSSENDENLLMTLLNDLKTNQKIQPLTAYLINFITQSVPSLINSESNKSPIKAKINIQYLHRIIYALKYIILNKNIFLAPKGFFSKILSCLLFIILQHGEFTNPCMDDLKLREDSSFVLVMFLKLYQRFSQSSIRHLMSNFFMPNLKDIEKIETEDEYQKFFTLYGLANCLIYFGGQMIDEFYLNLLKIANKLDKNEKSKIEYIVSSSLLNCFLVYFKWLIKKTIINQTESFKKIQLTYHQLNDIFGDSFVHRLNIIHLTYYPDLIESNVKIADEELKNIKITKFRKIESKDLSKTPTKLESVFDNMIKRKTKPFIKINYGSFKNKLTNSKEEVSHKNDTMNSSNIIIGKMKKSDYMLNFKDHHSTLECLYNSHI